MNSSTSPTWTFAQILEAISISQNGTLSVEQVSLVVKTIKQLNLAGQDPYEEKDAINIIQVCTGLKTLPSQIPGKKESESVDFFPLLEQLAQKQSQEIIHSIATQGEQLQMTITRSWQEQVFNKAKQMVYTTTLEQMAARIRGKLLLKEQTGENDGSPLLSNLYEELSQYLNQLRIKR